MDPIKITHLVQATVISQHLNEQLQIIAAMWKKMVVGSFNVQSHRYCCYFYTVQQPYMMKLTDGY